MTRESVRRVDGCDGCVGIAEVVTAELVATTGSPPVEHAPNKHVEAAMISPS